MIQNLLKEIGMMVIRKMEKEREKEFIIIIMVIDLKVNGVMIIKKEKKLNIFIMVIEGWEIIIMVTEWESM